MSDDVTPHARSEPTANLGLATTRELLEEIAARIEVSRTIGEEWSLDYRTVGGGTERVSHQPPTPFGCVHVWGRQLPLIQGDDREHICALGAGHPQAHQCACGDVDD